MPRIWLARCPYCRRWQTVDTSTWPARPVETAADPRAATESDHAGRAALLVPVVVSMIAVAGTLGVLLWHRDVGAIVAVAFFVVLVSATWWWWVSSGE